MKIGWKWLGFFVKDNGLDYNQHYKLMIVGVVASLPNAANNAIIRSTEASGKDVPLLR